MRPMRGFGRGGGGMGLPGLDAMAPKLAVALVAGSLLYILTRGGQGSLLLLNPGQVLGRFTVWQFFTYAFIETSEWGILFGALIIWSIGGFLESVWGGRRLLLASVGITALAGLLTVVLMVLGLVPPVNGYSGGHVMTTVMWVAYGLYIGRGQTNFWGIPLSGNALAAIGAGFTLFQVLKGPWYFFVPDVLALLLVFAYVRGASPRRLWLHLQHWRLQRQLRDRSKHLRVVQRDRPDRDQFLN